MSAVDVPPGVALADVPAGEFASAERSHRLARRVFVYVLWVGMASFLLASRRLYTPSIELLLVAPLVCISVASVGFAVRRARLRIDRDGVRWGWSIMGFRMTRERMRGVCAYGDAVAFSPARGSTWYVSRRDWARFDGVTAALGTADIPFEYRGGRAPFAARMQSYGLVLDLLLVANAMAATLTLLVTAFL